MSTIRPLRREDLPQVTDLYQRVARTGGAAPPGLAGYFARTFLDHPWADADLPSLVHESGDGRISGFLGSHARRLRLDDRPLRMGCSGQLVADPAARRRGVGALLLRRYLDGPQDLSITDGATEAVRQMWERLGGHTAYLRSMSWTRLFKPWRVAGNALLQRVGAGARARAALPVWSLLDTLTRRVLRVPEPPTRTVPLTPATLAGQAVAGRLRLDYDEAFARWLLDEAARVRTRGDLVHAEVQDATGHLLGWYVAYLRPDGISQVLQVAAAERDAGAVLDHLFADAQDRGVAALQGRLEPLLFEALAVRRCLFRPSERALVHARDPQVAAAALAGGLLTRLDGEWWMGHHLEPFAASGPPP